MFTYSPLFLDLVPGCCERMTCKLAVKTAKHFHGVSFSDAVRCTGEASARTTSTIAGCGGAAAA